MNVRFATKRRRATGFASSHSLLHRAVVGIQLEGRPARKLPRELCHGEGLRVREEDMPQEMARRLEVFVHKHYIRGQQGFTCYSFMRHLTGRNDQTTWTGRPYHYTGTAVMSDSLIPHEPYIMLRGEELMHGVVGLTPELCLSVLGDNGSLTIAPIGSLMMAYDAETLYWVDMAMPR